MNCEIHLHLYVVLLRSVALWLRVEFESLISASIVGTSTFILLSSANMLLCRRMCGTGF